MVERGGGGTPNAGCASTFLIILIWEKKNWSGNACVLSGIVMGIVLEGSPIPDQKMGLILRTARDPSKSVFAKPFFPNREARREGLYETSPTNPPSTKIMRTFVFVCCICTRWKKLQVLFRPGFRALVIFPPVEMTWASGLEFT